MLQDKFKNVPADLTGHIVSFVGQPISLTQLGVCSKSLNQVISFQWANAQEKLMNVVKKGNFEIIDQLDIHSKFALLRYAMKADKIVLFSHLLDKMRQEVTMNTLLRKAVELGSSKVVSKLLKELHPIASKSLDNLKNSALACEHKEVAKILNRYERQKDQTKTKATGVRSKFSKRYK